MYVTFWLCDVFFKWWMYVTITAWKVSVFGVILVRIFPHLGLIRIDTLYQSECGKIWTRITPNTNTFYTVYMCVCFREIVETWNNMICEKMFFEFSIFSISTSNFYRSNVKLIDVKRPFSGLSRRYYKSSLSDVFCRISVLRSFTKNTEKYLWWRPLYSNFARLCL